MADEPPPRYLRLEIPPHPTFGIDHLRKWYGDPVFENKARSFTARIDARVVHRLSAASRGIASAPRGLPDAMPHHRDGTLAGSVKALLVAMLEADEPPTLKRVSPPPGPARVRSNVSSKPKARTSPPAYEVPSHRDASTSERARH